MSRRERAQRLLNALPPAHAAWQAFRSRQLERAYAQRRDHYTNEAAARGLGYDEQRVAADIRARLLQRGYTPSRRAAGDVHTFAFVPQIGWHPSLMPDLQLLGPVTLFDYAAHGYGPDDFLPGQPQAAARREDMNRLALDALRAAHAESPVDWVYVYASGLEVGRRFLRTITDELGIPTVNMCLDDKQSWTGPVVGDQRLGQIDIAALFDVSWTSATVACEWYLVEGARPIYMPEGFDAANYRPMDVERDIPVSFVGAAYGFRAAVIRHLRRAGVPIQPFGPGWGTRPVWGDEQVEIFNRSVINLGMGGIGYSEWLTNVKTRDFEIPGTGGGMYLTTWNEDLAQHFDVGREIACYRDRTELVEQVNHFLAHPDEAAAMSARARRRCLTEHRWLHRYHHLVQILGIVSVDDAAAVPTPERAGE